MVSIDSGEGWSISDERDAPDSEIPAKGAVNIFAHLIGEVVGALWPAVHDRESRAAGNNIVAETVGRAPGGRKTMSYESLKVVHLFGIVIFLGNIIVTLLWKVMANRSGDPRIIAHAQRLVTLTDWIFTAGGVLFILIGAYGMAAVVHLDLLGTTWLIWGQALFVASGLIWVFILIPTQIAQARQARIFANGSAIPDSYWQHNRRWVIWGVIATIVPLANLYFMVFKP